MTTVRVVFVYLPVNADKGVTLGALLVIVIAIIVAIAAITILATQTDFISNAALYLNSLFTKTP